MGFSDSARGGHSEETHMELLCVLIGCVRCNDKSGELFGLRFFSMFFIGISKTNRDRSGIKRGEI